VTIAAATPLIALEVAVLDTETTGLDVRQDRVVQIGAVRMRGAELLPDPPFDRIVNPGRPIPPVASRVHGLTDADVASHPPLPALLPELLEWLGEAVVVGHSIHFDLAVLRHEARRHGLAWREPRVLDVAFLAAGLDRGLVDTSLDGLALGLGIAVEGRHTAWGDAQATARIYAALLPRLQEAGIRTLGEAETLSRRATDLIARQERAGWFDRMAGTGRPDYALAAMRAGGQRATDSFLYRTRLADVMSSPVIAIAETATVHEAAQLMHARGIGSVFVETAEGHGIVTERDMLRAMAQMGAEGGAAPIARFMSRPVLSAPADTLLYRALGLMARRHLRYLGVTEGGRLAGIFTLRTLLRERALATLAVGDEIATATGAADLARVQAALPGLAAGLLADGLEARAVAAIIAAENRAMAARAAELAEAELGPPPADYALLVLGSGGRGESLLAPDQDNALVIADDYAGNLDAAEDWFTRLATRVNETLDQAGIPLCKGGVMARNRPWRRRLSEWRAQLAEWARRPEPSALLNLDIFYDFTPAHAPSPGGAALAATLRDAATEAARRAPALLRAMGEIAGGHTAPLGLFGRIRRDEAGRVDLKSGALLPITAGARVIALRHGVTALSTPQRLRQAAERAGRGETDATLLADVHGFLLRLLLAQQIADLEAGITPGNRVELARLTRQDQDHLKDALGRIELMRDMLRDLLQGV
jgi:DNA polymerase-3 subunit epsilon/CBS domain-containing protein